MRILITLLFTIGAFSSAQARLNGSASLTNGKLRIDYADDTASKGLTDFVTLLVAEGALEEIVPNGSGQIEIYELKTAMNDVRIGGVIYRGARGEMTSLRLKIGAPLTDEVFATYGINGDFLHLKGDVASALWNLCKIHGKSGPSAAIRYDFGSVNCNKDKKTSTVECTIWNI